MTSAASFIEALNARNARTSRLRDPTRISWRTWLERLAEQPGRVTGAPAEDLVAQLLARPLGARPRRVAALNRWQAFGTLWRQQWHPASSDERRWRWTASGVSFTWHVLLVLFLLWVTALHLFPRPPDADQAVQVEFIGVGTPLDPGGGDTPAPANPSSQAASSAASSASPASSASSAMAASSTPSATPPATAAPAPTRVPAAAQTPATPAPQPLATTRPVSPEPPVFEVPPTNVEPPNPVALQTPQPRLQVLDTPKPPRAPPVPAPPMTISVQPMVAPAPVVVQREVPAPTRVQALREPTPAPAPAPNPTPTPVTSSVPAASATVTASPSPAPSRAQPSPSGTGTAARPAASPGTARPSASASTGPANLSTAGVGTGPKPAPSPGSFPTPRRGDDWGDSKRNVSGTRGAGLYDGNGQPRVGAPPGSASAGFPPGSVTQEIHDFDRSGTWLKRKPNPYEPTRFDRFWRPNETLLEEWVSRGFKKVTIPIPGTNKHLDCGISLLQLGGGCRLVDPNLNEQPATARPPPDVPFKPWLQQGDGFTAPPPGKPPARDPHDPFPIPKAPAPDPAAPVKPPKG